MTTSKLKLVALITMVIDHIGLIFFPGIEALRIIGRLSFPIFAFTLAHGFINTRNKNVYAFRLFLFAVIAEIPYDLAVHDEMYYWDSQSVMLELFLCFMVLYFIEFTINKNILFIFGALACILCTEIFASSYGLYGVTIVIVFYLFRNFRGADVIVFLLVTYLFYGLTTYEIDILGKTYSILSMNEVQLYACLAVIPLVLYNSERGLSKNKWFFYFFYPVHFIILYAINGFLGNVELIQLWW